jgi:hypothetical protein
MTAIKGLLAVVAIGGGSAIGAGGCAGTLASQPKIPSAAQYAAIADDVCAGVPAKERDLGLLAYREAIVSVAPLNEDSFVGKIKVSNTEGTVIGLRALPGISIPWLERVNSCHVALVGSGRINGSETVADPFAIPGSMVSAAEIYAGYVVFVRGMNHDAAMEISRQANALLLPTNHPPTASLVSP